MRLVSITNSLLLLMATVLRQAFPPTVIADTSAETLTARIFSGADGNDSTIFKTRVAVHAPDIMLQQSPITSLQMFETTSAFLTSLIAVLLPLTFLDAMETSGASSHDVTETPTPSKIMPIATNTNSKMLVNTMPRLSVISDNILKTPTR